MAKRVKKWFHPKRESRFDKTKSVEANIRTMRKNCPKNMNSCSCWRLVGKQSLALSNVTKDPETKTKAKAVSKEAFSKLERCK